MMAREQATLVDLFQIGNDIRRQYISYFVIYLIILVVYDQILNLFYFDLSNKVKNNLTKKFIFC